MGADEIVAPSAVAPSSAPAPADQHQEQSFCVSALDTKFEEQVREALRALGVSEAEIGVCRDRAELVELLEAVSDVEAQSALRLASSKECSVPLAPEDADDSIPQPR